MRPLLAAFLFLYASLPSAAQDIDFVLGARWESLTISGPRGPAATFRRDSSGRNSGPWQADFRNGQFKIVSSQLPTGDYHALYSWRDDGSGETGSCGIRVRLQGTQSVLVDFGSWLGNIALRAEGPQGGEIFLRKIDGPSAGSLSLNWLRARSVSRNGFVRFSGLPWGRYVTEAPLKEGCPTSVNRDGLTLVQLPFRAVGSAIEISSASPNRIVSNRWVTFARIALGSTRRVRVTVDGRPAKGHRVRFVRDDMAASGDAFPYCGQASTGADGIATFAAPAGNYLIAVRDPGSAEALWVAVLGGSVAAPLSVDLSSSRRPRALSFVLTSTLLRGVDPTRTAVLAQFIPTTSGIALPGSEANRRQRSLLDTIGILTLPGSGGVAPMTAPLKTTLAPGTYRVVIQLVPRNNILEPNAKGLGRLASLPTVLTRTANVTIKSDTGSIVVLVP